MAQARSAGAALPAEVSDRAYPECGNEVQAGMGPASAGAAKPYPPLPRPSRARPSARYAPLDCLVAGKNLQLRPADAQDGDLTKAFIGETTGVLFYALISSKTAYYYLSSCGCSLSQS